MAIEGVVLPKQKSWKDSDKQAYRVWRGMLHRCYDIKDIGFETYGAQGVRVSEEWLTFENFEEWYISNRANYQSGEKLHVDKDILVSGNRTYCKENCLLIPAKINQTFYGFNESCRVYEFIQLLKEYKDIIDIRIFPAIAREIEKYYLYIGYNDDNYLPIINKYLKYYGTFTIQFVQDADTGDADVLRVYNENK